MSEEITQSGRLLEIKTPLGPDVLLINSIDGEESLSRLFAFELDLLAENSKAPSVKAEKIIGKNVTVSLQLAGGSKRFFNGIVSRFSQGAVDDRFTHYSATLVPWIWRLTLWSDCRVFQSKNVQDIVKQVFSDADYSDFRFALTKAYTPMDYCVQYRETHFNFISRLLEQDGIYYYFEHKDSSHTVVFSDAPQGHLPNPKQKSAAFGPHAGVAEEDFVDSWRVEKRLHPGKFTHRDYHFQMASKTLEQSQPTKIKIGENGPLEIFDYPGEYAQRFKQPDQRLSKVQPEGKKLAEVRMDEEETSHEIHIGSSSCRAFTAGYKFDLTGHLNASLNGTYVLSSVHHSAGQVPGYVSDVPSAPYVNSITCIPYAVPFRPPRTTPKPIVQGLQTAKVVGASGEIWTDRYGRIKVQFHWDRDGTNDDHSSCWVRVAQSWAGKNWGSWFLPRIGQEVVVAFLEGDPDAPLVVGSVYNSENMPPYTLPDNQTQSGIKSRSSLHGSSSNFNELRFEDKKGTEEVYLQAEKDWNVLVKHDKTQEIKNDEKSTIGNNRTKSVGNDESVTIGHNETISIANDLKRDVGMKETFTVGTDYSGTAGMNITLKAGMKLELVGPGGKITIDPSGITIQGILVRIN